MKKINWKFGVVSAVAAGLMFASVPGVALAATVDGEIGSKTAITKSWTAASETQLNNTETFNFNLKYKSYEPKGTTGEASSIIQQVNKSVQVNGNWLDNATSNSASMSITNETLFGDIDFDKPGVYEFTLTEVPGNNANIKYDSTSYTVIVNVEWDVDEDNNVPTGSTVINSIYFENDATDLKQGDDGAVFNNTAEDNSNVTLKKSVAGTAADTGKDFTFTITLSNVTGEYMISTPDGDATIENGSATVTLHHGESATIKNLPVGAIYTISENADGYEATYVVTDGEVVGSETSSSTYSGTVDKTDDIVAFTNEKGFMPQTGITMNTLPFVGVGVVAAAGAVTLVISRKRRAGEDF